MAMGKRAIRPGWADWNAASLGLTRGGQSVAVAPSFKEDKVDQLGVTVIDKFGEGLAKVTADLKCADMSAARVATATGETAVGSAVKIHAGTFLGTSLITLAKQLACYPIIAGAKSGTAQFIMPLAFPLFELEMPFSENPQAIKMGFVGFPDESDSYSVATFNEMSS